MKRITILLLGTFFLAACTTSTPTATPTALPTSPAASSPTPRNLMLPTWTPSPTPLRKPTVTPGNTSTPTVVPGETIPTLPASIPSIARLFDRPTYAQLPKPENLVSLDYDPSAWQLNSYYPTNYMGYSLTSRSIYGCKLEPSVGKGAEGYDVEHYNRDLGSTSFQVARVSQAGILLFANYCTGENQDYTCYQVTPGDDHEACTTAAEEVLSTYQLIPNPFFASADTAPNRWICQDAAGTVGICSVSYSVPLNALAFSTDGTGWAVGDKGVIYSRIGQNWSEVSSPAQNALYDLSFASPSDGWAVGDGAQVLRWDGKSWTETLPYHGPGEGPGGSSQILYAVDAYAKDDAWMVGAMKGIDGKTQAYVLHWDGTQLVEPEGLPDCNCGLKTVLVVGKDNVYAAGGSDLGAIMFHWDGQAWTSSVLPGTDTIYTLNQSGDGMLWAGGIEVSRDRQDTRGALFYWDGAVWQRVALPPITGGIYALAALPDGRLVVGGDFTALRAGLDWQPISTDIFAYQWMVDIEQDLQGNVWALTRSGNIFELGKK